MEMIEFREDEISCLACELPEALKFLKYSGDFEAEIRAADAYLEKDIPAVLRRRLELEKVIARVTDGDYCVSYGELKRRITEKYPACGDAELGKIIDAGYADFIMKDGGMLFLHSAPSNVLNCCRAYLSSLQSGEERAPAPNAMRRENERIMREKGYRAVRITVEEKLSVDPDAGIGNRTGEKIRVWLPYPAECEWQSGITMLGSSHPATVGRSAQRTVYIETPYVPGDVYSVTFAYTLRVPYFRLDPAAVTFARPNFHTGEQWPHIRFTPAVLALASELRGKGNERNPLILARRAYDWVTRNVVYSYMREYIAIDNIVEYALLNRRGDCGVQALLFITLCRAMGVPARWQSGSHVKPDSIGSHDWAQFYVAPWGWLWADPSFGGGARRDGDELLWNHYFGNLDVFRQINCTEFQATFDPPKKYLRCDPYDDQSGEAEFVNRGLGFGDLRKSRRVIGFEELI